MDVVSSRFIQNFDIIRYNLLDNSMYANNGVSSSNLLTKGLDN